MLHLPDLTRLVNDPICHDPRWPPMPMKLPLNIPKFEAKPNEDPGDHVTTFHLWCPSNSLKMTLSSCDCFNALLSRVPRNGT
jgi:hypothetical protein